MQVVESSSGRPIDSFNCEPGLLHPHDSHRNSYASADPLSDQEQSCTPADEDWELRVGRSAGKGQLAFHPDQLPSMPIIPVIKSGVSYRDADLTNGNPKQTQTKTTKPEMTKIVGGSKTTNRISPYRPSKLSRSGRRFSLSVISSPVALTKF